MIPAWWRRRYDDRSRRGLPPNGLRVTLSPMLRPCVACAYRYDPTRSERCPECGEPRLPLTWTVLVREPSPWLWRGAHIGSILFLTVVAYWIYALLVGSKSVGVGGFVYLGVISLPISLARLSGKRFDDIWIISEKRLEHRPSRGSTTFHEPADGWVATTFLPHARKPHLWVLRLKRERGRKTERAELLIDDRNDDPVAVEARVRAVLTPASTSDT
jgi:hypothetical protein